MKRGFDKGNKVFAYKAVEIVNISKMNQNTTEIRIPFFATLMLPDAIILDKIPGQQMSTLQ